MVGDEKKLAESSLIPLEIDPTSILSLSKGVIFDTIVHNIECTLNNRQTNPLPWKLTGMSLICDPSRNKKYMQKLQKMQCVPSVICTQIYHSKLVKTEAGALTTPGKKILLRSTPLRRLTGVFVCRSIDELLAMEPSNTENVHYIQYKLLSYEYLATRELVNGPKLTAVGDRIIKTVFDFELAQNYGFPRQLLPVAIVSFSREAGCDLTASIRHFLNLEDHKVFDKSYLVTSTSVESDRLREERERKEDAEAEQEFLNEDIQRRQPLADLSKKSTGITLSIDSLRLEIVFSMYLDTGNTRVTDMSAPSMRPPLKIKIPLTEKTAKQSVADAPLDRKFRCLLQLDRLDLSKYSISNIKAMAQMKNRKSSELTALSSDSTHQGTKSLIITKPHKHHKPLKRLNNEETKRQSTSLSEIFKEKRSDETRSVGVSAIDMTVSSAREKSKERSDSSSSMSPIYRPLPSILKRLDKDVKKKKVVRPSLPTEYRCSLPLTQIDLSMYDLDLPPLPTTSSITTESLVTTSPSDSTSSSERRTDSSNNAPAESENVGGINQQTFTLEQESNQDLDDTNLFDGPMFDDINTNVPLPNIIDEFLTPDLNDALLTTDIEVDLTSSSDIVLRPVNSKNDISSSLVYETVPEAMNDILTDASNACTAEVTDAIASAAATEVPASTTNHEEMDTSNDIQMDVSNENHLSITTADQSETTNETLSNTVNEEAIKSNSPDSLVAYSPTLPPLDDDPILLSVETPQLPIDNVPNPDPQEYLIIVPCSDDEDYPDDDDDITTNKTDSKIITTDDVKKKPAECQNEPVYNEKTSPPLNPLLSRVLTNLNRSNSDRLSISPTSSCSSISASILQNQYPQSPLQLTVVSLSQKILNKRRRTSNCIAFPHFNMPIPLLAHEPLIDPRLIYRLQTITTDLRWPTPCNQCSISSHHPSLSTSTTQMISLDRKCVSNCIDPRRATLKIAILNFIHQRLKLLIPNIFIINSNEFQHLLFEQTTFETNCSLHLEHLLDKLNELDDVNFFQLLKI
ncbi:unnamed protein product [Adineta ricciae]|uniref:Uncharacterized protein n=1 Tax=Adineta ricciae TaxID=249248 RepID=A0A813WX75_ADIRI|nr:unnamed protein product [Adineta ricciae]